MKKIYILNLSLILISFVIYLIFFKNYPFQLLIYKISMHLFLVKEYLILSILLAYLTQNAFIKNRKIFNKYFFFSIFNILLFPQIISWIENLSFDSFLTIFETNLSEIKFYIKTLYFYLIPTKHNLLLVLVSIFFYLNFFFFHGIFIKKKIVKYTNYLSLILISFILINPIYEISKNLKDRLKIEKNFTIKKNKINDLKQNDLNMFLYIGESTSTMNMGLYGYFRNTTPNLSKLRKDEKFIYFDKVLSNHTHTSPSLISALSFQILDNNNLEDIFNQKRVSIFDYLSEKNELKIFSYENKSILYKTLFKNTKNIQYNKSPIIKGKIQNSKTDFDHLVNVLNEFTRVSNKNKIYLFHSYAGHGPYLENIDNDFKKKVDKFYSNKNLENIFGNKNIQTIQNLEDYDSTIKFIDNNLNYVVKNIQKSKKPSVLIYFSDHGESIFTNNAHDSSRPLHEMLRVPFILYFNNAALDRYQDKIYKYKNLSKKKKISTLSQLPMTIFDLLGIDNKKFMSYKNNKIIANQEFNNLSKILVRKNMNTKKKVEFLDSGTKMFFEIEKNRMKNKNLNICYGRSNTIGKIQRGSLITNCLETDVNYTNGDFEIKYSNDGTGLKLNEYFSIIKNKNISVWFDLKNLNEKNCSNFFNELDNYSNSFNDIFLEINSIKNINIKFKNCLEQNSLKYNIGISFEAISNLCNFENSNSFEECEFKDHIEYLFTNKIVKSITLNFQKKDKIEKYPFKNYKINYYNVKLDDISKFKDDTKPSYITIDNGSDPNNL